MLQGECFNGVCSVRSFIKRAPLHVHLTMSAQRAVAAHTMPVYPAERAGTKGQVTPCSWRARLVTVYTASRQTAKVQWQEQSGATYCNQSSQALDGHHRRLQDVGAPPGLSL